MKIVVCQPERETRIGILTVLLSFFCAVVLLSLLTCGNFEMPQKKGESLLSLISDDTRMVLSSSMMEKADNYFHGGVTAEGCTLEHHAAESLMGDDEHEHHHVHEHPDHAGTFSLAAMQKPFLWINSQIHAQEHRHLEYEHAVEMLPWVSAAVRISPHNIQAYESGSYILNRMTGKPELAVDLLNQGITNNPANVSLELSLSEIYFNNLKNRKTASVHLKRALQKSLAKKGGFSEEDLFQRLKAYFYLGVIARDEHDIEKLKELSRKAYEINPNNVMTQSLFKWLKKESEKE